MVKKISWKGQKLHLVKKYFESYGGMTVLLMDETNFPVVKVNHKSVKYDLNRNEIIVNNHNSNKGIKEKLIHEGYLIPTNKWVEIDNQLCEICRIT
mgnify:CR=1 FL=1